MNSGSLPFKVVTHLAMNPGKTLTNAEIADRWSADRGHIKTILRSVLDAEYIAVEGAGKRGRGQVVTYSAGPRLLKMREA